MDGDYARPAPPPFSLPPSITLNNCRRTHQNVCFTVAAGATGAGGDAAVGAACTRKHSIAKKIEHLATTSTPDIQSREDGENTLEGC